MIRYIKHSEIDKIKWDRCIRGSIHPLIYAVSWYLDVVSPGWDALIEGDYKLVMPVTWKKKYGISYICQPHFTQQLGIFGKTASEKIQTDEFTDVLKNHYKYIEMNINQNNSYSKSTFNIIRNCNYELHLNSPYEKLAADFSLNTNRNIKKAQSAGLRIDITNSKEDAISLVKQFRRNIKRKHPELKKDYFDTLKNIIEITKEKNGLTVIKCQAEDDKVIACAFFITYEKRSIFIFSGNSEDGRKYGAMHLIINKFIDLNAGNDIILDFEGSNNPGLARFYKSFGSKEYLFLRLKRNNLSYMLKYIKR